MLNYPYNHNYPNCAKSCNPKALSTDDIESEMYDKFLSTESPEGEDTISK